MSYLRKPIIQYILTVTLLGLITVNTLYWRTPYLGLPATVLLGCFVTQFLRHVLQLRKPGETVVAFMVLFASVTLINLLAFYFFSFQKVILLSSVWVISLSALFFAQYRDKKILDVPHEEFDDSPPMNRYGFLALPIGLIASLVYIAEQVHIQRTQFIYNGFFPEALQSSAVLLFVAFVATGIVILSRMHRRYVWLMLLSLYLASTAMFAIGLQTLYGADSWRHVSAENYVAQEHTYQPTSLRGLLAFSSEKIPNATQYTAVPVLSHLTQVDVLHLHKYLAWVFLGPVAVFLIFSIVLLFTASTRTAFFVTLLSFIANGVTYIGQVTYPQAFGIILLLATILVWSRYALGRDARVGIPHIVITLLAILTYPTTALISLVVAIAGFFIRRIKKGIPVYLTILSVIFFSILFAIPFPALDTLFKNIPIDQQYVGNSFQVIRLFQTQAENLWGGAINGLTIVPTLIGVGGAVWLLLKRKRRIFGIVLLALVCGLQLVQFFNAYAPAGTYFVFSNRVALMHSVLATSLLAVGVVVIIRKTHWQKSIIIGLIILFGLIFMRDKNLSVINFGYSISQREISLIQAIAHREQGQSYIVLSDEVTAAAGSALTGFAAGHYYWYPGGGISDAYWNSLRNPFQKTLVSICSQFGVGQVYLIVTPIPPNERYKTNIERLEKLMQKTDQQGESATYQFSCSQNVPAK